MDKYYTPEIEEFHIGFEYEWLNEDSIWIKECSPTEISEEGFDEQTYGLRVKYLDKEDIESFGFIKDYERASGPVWYRDGWQLKSDGINIYELRNINKEYIFKFYGIIKNKSELKKLLKQLNIYETK